MAIVVDDFDKNNIIKLERFDSSDVYNRIVLAEASSEGMYIFACNFGGQSTVQLDTYSGTSRYLSSNITASERAIVEYINNSSDLRSLGVTAQIIKNYKYGANTFDEAILIRIDSDPKEIFFVAEPYYLLFSPLDYTIDESNNQVIFVPYEYNPNVLYSDILFDRASELKYGVQLLSANIDFISNDFVSYKNLVDNYLGFYKNKLSIITLQVDYNMSSTIPLEDITVRLNNINQDKYKFLHSWDEYGSYIHKKFFLIGSGKLGHNEYKIKLKEKNNG